MPQRIAVARLTLDHFECVSESCGTPCGVILQLHCDKSESVWSNDGNTVTVDTEEHDIVNEKTLNRSMTTGNSPQKY